LALGIGLRNANVPVTIWEASHYPRHKVCGEFISGCGLRMLERFGLLSQLVQAGGRWANDAVFFANDSGPVRFTLRQPALCLSRYVLDQRLAEEFQRRGGELRKQERWSGDFLAPGVVRATGRRVVAAVNGWRWFGLKAHARGVTLAADLELHLRDDGYIGLCRLADTVNVCGLFRSRQPIRDLRAGWQEMLGDAMRGRTFKWVEDSFCAVAGLCVEPRPFEDDAECAVGDALTMIPPATGNGMSMALEAAELALAPLVGYCRGAITWNEAQQTIIATCRQQFAARLRIAGQLHALMFLPLARFSVGALLRLGNAVERAKYGERPAPMPEVVQ
jgi:2-polyprenyl-6-methoxyphenol hydroxylase-like FAD-dependent oxidoreductase